MLWSLNTMPAQCLQPCQSCYHPRCAAWRACVRCALCSHMPRWPSSPPPPAVCCREQLAGSAGAIEAHHQCSSVAAWWPRPDPRCLPARATGHEQVVKAVLGTTNVSTSSEQRSQRGWCYTAWRAGRWVGPQPEHCRQRVRWQQWHRSCNCNCNCCTFSKCWQRSSSSHKLVELV